MLQLLVNPKSRQSKTIVRWIDAHAACVAAWIKKNHKDMPQFHNFSWPSCGEQPALAYEKYLDSAYWYHKKWVRHGPQTAS